LAKAIELVGAKTPFQKCTSVWSRRCVTLNKDLVCAGWVVCAFEEVVETNFVE
jgi:hypothetical protein